jgi:hypothetical protein
MAEPKVDADSAGLALMELAEEFGAEDLSALLPIAMEGRLYLDKKLAVYVLRKPIELKNGTELKQFAMREPNAEDFLAYSQGVVVRVGRDKSTEIDIVMIGKRTLRAVSLLADEPIGVVERIDRKALDELTNIGDALGFFD